MLTFIEEKILNLKIYSYASKLLYKEECILKKERSEDDQDLHIVVNNKKVLTFIELKYFSENASKLCQYKINLFCLTFRDHKRLHNFHKKNKNSY